MFTHNFSPILFDLGFFSLRWYSLAYIIGIIFGWWYGKKIILFINNKYKNNFKLDLFDDYITYVIISIIIGGRLGYVLFYNLSYFILNPIEIFFIWKGGMSFHGGLLGIIAATMLFSKRRGFDKMVVIGHPKGMTEYSFKKLKSFIHSPSNKNSFITFDSLK